MIGRSGERGSVLTAQHDDDDDDLSIYLSLFISTYPCRGIPCGVVANELNRDIVESEFELQSHYYVHFRTYKLRKNMNLLIPRAMG